MIESMKPTCGVILILVSAFIAVPALATEKYTIARYTDIAVVGKFSDVRTARHFHGWRLTGNLIVEESLYGSIPQGTRLYYEFDCSDCPVYPRIYVKTIFNTKGLWFLRRSNRGWAPAGTERGDPGHRSIEYRNDMANFFRVQRPQENSK